ncbi:MAG TPA: hypothetical protein VFS89_06605 [Nitrosospira sp.]|nr:hypothetical protein [Nitrosospira sp.]
MESAAVLFVVRGSGHSKLLYKIPLATYHAYNCTGGGASTSILHVHRTRQGRSSRCFARAAALVARPGAPLTTTI